MSANTIQLNIKNLTELWKTVSEFHSTSQYNYIAKGNLKWPNRLWFNGDVTQEKMLSAKNKVFSQYKNLVIAYCDIYGSNSSKIFEQHGFVKQFEQVGMSLKLTEQFETSKKIKLNLVTNIEEGELWSELFMASFGYEIHPKIVANTHKKVKYYIACFKDKAVGTAITYQTENVTGIHAVGIIPEYRRMGYADLLMRLVLNEAIKDKSEYVTLQASDLGKKMYLNLGFREDFVLKNYAL